jgi:hypothetical protein
MWTVQRPTESALDAFRAITSKLPAGDLRDRLDLIEGDIVQASDEFEVAAAAVALHTLSRTNGVAGMVTTSEMVDIYNRRFARKGSPGRAIYDAIRSAPEYGRCPLCGHGTVWTVDHHLPKSIFPSLAVAPLNLVPACMDCNKFKLSARPNTAEDETLHPYFDDIEDDPWLVADVIEVRPAALKFYVQSPAAWTTELSERVWRNFAMLKLPYRYGVEAAREISNLRKIMSKLYARSSNAGVRGHLSEMADSYRASRVNSWQTAMYRALAASDWYCDRGFRL